MTFAILFAKIIRLFVVIVWFSPLLPRSVSILPFVGFTGIFKGSGQKPDVICFSLEQMILGYHSGQLFCMCSPGYSFC